MNPRAQLQRARRWRVAASGAVPSPHAPSHCFRECGTHSEKSARARWARRRSGAREQTAELSSVSGRGQAAAARATGDPRLVQPCLARRCLVRPCLVRLSLVRPRLVRLLTRGCSPRWCLSRYCLSRYCLSRCCQPGIVSAWFQAKFAMPLPRCSETVPEPMPRRRRPGRGVRAAPERRLRRMEMRFLRQRRANARP